jgi:hypothetical protein
VTSEKPLAEDGSCLAKCGDDEKLATNDNMYVIFQSLLLFP